MSRPLRDSFTKHSCFFSVCLCELRRTRVPASQYEGVMCSDPVLYIPDANDPASTLPHTQSPREKCDPPPPTKTRWFDTPDFVSSRPSESVYTPNRVGQQSRFESERQSPHRSRPPPPQTKKALRHCWILCGTGARPKNLPPRWPLCRSCWSTSTQRFGR